MILSYSHGREFVDQVRPLLERGDLDSLVDHLQCHWPNDRLRALLICGHEDARKVALLCLSLVGTMADNPAIASCLHDDDAMTASLAEHAMWSTWFGAGGVQASAQLTRAVRLMGADRLDEAAEVLDDLVRRCPKYAEAYNQRAIAHFLKGDYSQAIEDCREALRLNEHHFGAMAGLGHSFASVGQLGQALEAYRSSLQLHPRMEGIRQSIQQIRSHVATGPASPSVAPSRTSTEAPQPSQPVD